MRRGGGPAVEELALEGDTDSVKFSVSNFSCTFVIYNLGNQDMLECVFYDSVQQVCHVFFYCTLSLALYFFVDSNETT